MHDVDSQDSATAERGAHDSKTAPPSSTVAADPGNEALPGPRRMGRRSLLIAGASCALFAAGGIAVAVKNPFKQSTDDDDANGATTTGTALAKVEKQTLTSLTRVDGTLGYAGAIDVVTRVDGTLTSLPAVGQVVSQGGILFGLNASPVLLMYGAVPAYRDMPAGTATADRTGPDIQQLNAALVVLGYATADQIDPNSNIFDAKTKQAVKNLQWVLGVKQTGTFTLGQIVFSAGPIRVKSTPSLLGAPVQAGSTVLQGTTTTPLVIVELNPSRQSEVKSGDKVAITLPNNTVTDGIVWSVGTVATESSAGDGATVIKVEIVLADPSVIGTLDEAPVLVAITTATADNALVVPVASLLALAGGGYAVEVQDDGGTRHLVPVTVGLFDDAKGLVEITDSALKAGQHVVVPST